VLLAGIGGAVAGNVAAWSQAIQTGADVPFTAGTILIPAIPAVLATLLALFARSPRP